MEDMVSLFVVKLRLYTQNVLHKNLPELYNLKQVITVMRELM